MQTNYRLGDCRQKRHTCDAHLILPCVAQRRVHRKGGAGGRRPTLWPEGMLEAAAIAEAERAPKSRSHSCRPREIKAARGCCSAASLPLPPPEPATRAQLVGSAPACARGRLSLLLAVAAARGLRCYLRSGPPTSTACHRCRSNRLRERHSWAALGATCLRCSPSPPLVGCAPTCARGRPPPPLAVAAARTGYASATCGLR